MKLRRVLSLIAVSTVFVGVAQAHPGHDGHELTWDFAGGVIHPLSGWDHLLAMISVGVWATVLGGKARWLLPATFVGTMLAAGTAAMQWGASSVTPGLIEQGIAASLLGMGFLLAVRVRMPLVLATMMVAVFAAFHGWAHGLEVPANANGLSYSMGFAVATAFLHTVGLAVGYSTRHYTKLTRAAGVLVAAAGVLAAVS